MKRADDRTPEQKKTHTVLIVATDKFLSGWGGAAGGLSYAAWACKPEHQGKVFDWVSSRGEMRRVRIVADPYYPGPACAHLHIYVVNEGHNSLAEPVGMFQKVAR